MLNKNLIDKNIFEEKKVVNILICKKFDIYREEQNMFLYNSYIKVIFTEKNFLFSQEILPIKYNNIIVSKKTLEKILI